MTQLPREPVAIIGSACRLPGEASSPSSLWSLLANPRDVLTKIPPTRFEPDGYYHEDGEYHGSTNVKESYLLSEDHRLFDAHFFKIKPIEAHCMDPQQRLLMETVYEGLEASGLTVNELQGSDTAVYVGLMCEEYSAITTCDVDQLPTYTATGTGRSIMSNRVSYFFDWHGPCMTIDTACSSSLVSVHQAVETLRNGTSKLAIAAGSNLLIGPTGYITESKLHMLSPGSRSRMWDSEADGYARGDGVGVLVLKKLSDAIRDGDHIECLIRETGVNQDGRTTGITMPSSTAQEALIRSTYARAGLDITKPEDRCQFFEAHGTGTPAGDPIEAEAIHNSFFGKDNKNPPKGDKLYVGSIKTVVGHTEGTAGIAAVMKASLAIQNSTIPPNMLFNRLNPAVEPFYAHVEIATSSREWPVLPKGVPRRASVNSFGFGGTNAHAILEEYTAETGDDALPTASPSSAFIPFCISAASQTSLLEQARRLNAWLSQNPHANLSDLAWTLSSRRSEFAHRWSFSASSSEQLKAEIEKRLSTSYEPAPALTPEAKILGVFTGQGAQWATMAGTLVRSSKFAEQIIDNLEASLAVLPDAPAWSLKAEMLADAEHSRVSEAVLSQPLCTAVQILLVEMLKSLGISFSAVVGHSSGEIAAAYAAGFLRAEDAIRIAFYRGVHTKLAAGHNGEKGAMLAAGASLEDARELCEFEELQGRISVAASNSSSSTTLSGDIDAIQEAKEVLEDEKKFARLLRVDKAYHSHHMDPCAEPYLESLRKCAIQIGQGDSGCSWISSVNEEEISSGGTQLDGEYWIKNMTQCVLFSQAVQKAVETKGPFDIVIEIGPHPALQGPTLQNIQDLTGDRIPYTGLLTRQANDVDSFAGAIGYLWRHSVLQAESIESYSRTISGGQSHRVLKGLPSYAFDHDTVYWRESRLSKAIRTRKTPYHELLGMFCPDGTSSTHLRWKNLLSIKEIPWLSGHAVQSQVVFPAAGYMSMAIDACRLVAPHRQIQSLDLLDFVIGKAIIFDERSLGVETMLVLTLDDEVEDKKDSFNGTLRIYAGAAGPETTSLVPRSSCRVRVTFGQPVPDLLPPRASPISNSVDVDADKFYDHLSNVGYVYTGPFRGLTSLRRTLDAGTALITNPARVDAVRSPTAHPATLDCTVQSVLLGFCYPGDGKLYALNVPTKISRVSINLPLLEQQLGQHCLLPVDSVVNETGVISGDAHLFTADGDTTLLQMQGIEVTPLTPPRPDSDAQMFFGFEMGVAAPDGELMMKGQRATEADYTFAVVCERIAYFYLKRLLGVLSPKDIENAEWHHKRLVDFGRKALGDLQSGLDPLVDPNWYNDTEEEIFGMMEKYKHKVEISLTRAVGENLPAAVRGETVIIEHMMANNVLNDVYSHGLGFSEYSHFLSEAVAQVAHRYPHMNILEIGAGTGGATKRIVPKLGKAFSSYTFTDISGGFFPNAQEVFEQWSDCMIYKVLDAEKDVVEQGFKEHSYDFVIAALVIHATKDLSNTVRNVRRLLKPGGYFAMLELTNLRPIRVSFCMSGLEGWWLGSPEDGRQYSPCVDANKWNSILRENGFSSIDAITPDLDPEPWPFNIIVAQAVDDRLTSLRDPLSTITLRDPAPQELIILGGEKLQTSLLADQVDRLLSRWFSGVRRIARMEDLLDAPVGPRATVVSLADLDRALFKDITTDRLDALKTLLENSTNVLWVTSNVRTDPYANMTIGFGRTAVVEMPHLRLQFLDFSNGAKVTADALAEALIRLLISDELEDARQNDEFLWSVECELYTEGDRTLIPRLRATRDRNDRYNSTRRAVVKHVSPEVTPLSVTPSLSSYVVEEDIPVRSVKQEGTITLQLSHSVLQPLSLSPEQSFFVSLGTTPADETNHLVLSNSLSSTVSVPVESVLPLDGCCTTAASILTSFTGAVMARRIIANVNPGSHMVCHETPSFLLHHLLSQSEAKGITLLRTTSTSAKAVDASLLNIHPRTSARRVNDFLPKSVSLFVDLSSPDTASNDIGGVISVALSGQCRTMRWTDLFDVNLNAEDAVPSPDSIELATVSLPVQHSEHSLEELSLGDLSHSNLTTGAAHILSWKSGLAVPVQVKNVDAAYRFKEDCTYILFGLSGQLGKSLCTWMVRRGARHVVLTSRSPALDEPWVKDMELLGAVVKVKSNDITNRDSVESFINEIRSTMPAIAGVANGAMVLQDTAIREMSPESLNSVLQPKVAGSRYLDEILRDDELDFFVFFSSLATVFGNHGQSNYTAANMFMNALAGQRRKRGQAGSIIAIGAVTGIGYMARELSDKDNNRIKESGYSSLSERDFHQLFCEGILAGRPESGLHPEVICGVRIGQSGDKRPVTWHTNPMFSHCMIKRDESRKDETSDALLPVKTSLLAAKSREEARSIISDSFLRRLQGMLQSDRDVPLTLAADELGVDSLVAVDIRSWFLKELDVDLPVLKILGGASVQDMLEYAVENISPSMIPNVGEGVTDEVAKPVQHDTRPELTPRFTAVTESDVTPQKSSENSSAIEASQDSQSSVESDVAVDEDKPESAPVIRAEPMSSGQSRFWFLQNYLADKTAFNIVTMITIQGNLRVADLSRAVDMVGNHHEALRTKFYVDDQGHAMQGILERSTLALQHKAAVGPEDAAKEFNRIKNHIYDLENGSIMQISLLSSGATHYLTIGYHHINMDGISLGVLLGDMHNAYRGMRLPPTLQYVDYSAKQRQLLDSGGMKDEIKFWTAEFNTLPEALPILPFSRTTCRRPLDTYETHVAELTVPLQIASQLKRVVQAHRVSPFHVYLTVFRVLLTRLTDVEEIVIGMGDANRMESEVQNAIGMYLNLLPLRFRATPKQRFDAAIKESQSKVRKALAHSRMPFDALLELLQPPRSADSAPLFQAFIDYRQPMADRSRLFDCRIVKEEYVRGDTAYDVALDIIDTTKGDAHVQFAVPKLLYSESDVQVLLDTFMGLLEAFTGAPTSAVEEVPLFSEREVQKALRLGRGRSVESTWKSLPLRLGQTAQGNGDLVAVRDGHGQCLTYKQLDARISAISSKLSSSGVESGSVIAVLQEPTVDWAVSVLAILRMNLVYVPLDTRSPLQRLSAIIQDSKPAIILAHGDTLKLMDQLETPARSRIIAVDDLAVDDIASFVQDTDIEANPDRTSFILYTSGSSGVPKGVLLKQSNLLNQIENTVKYYGVEPGWTVLQQTAYSFDISLWQLLIATTSGASLYIVPQHLRSDALALSRIIADENISITGGTPSQYSSWLRHGDREAIRRSNWRVVNCGGETLSPALQAEFRDLGKPDLHLYNAYAPCEATFVSNEIEIDYHGMDDILKSVDTPVGYSLPNYSVYILDEQLKPVPAGVKGQIAIGGAGVAAGYLDSRLGDKVFVHDPFATERDIREGWTTMYLTGDEGVLRRDGALVFVSRRLSQNEVKIRGMRFNLEDVETNLVQAAGGVLAQAVASLRGSGDAQFLVAHVTFGNGRAPEDKQALFQRLLTDLPVPGHMKPTMLLDVDALPLTVNSKVDRAAVQQLPLPDSPQVATQDHELTGVEARILELWNKILPAEVLKLKPVGPNSDFFNIGGNSLLLVKLQAEINKCFGSLIPLIQLFEVPTVRGIASRLTSGERHDGTGLIDWEEETRLSLSEPVLTVPITPPVRRVVLTGSTGFLGRAIVAHLLEQPSIERIDCIAVRDKSSRPLPHVLTSSPKVHLHAGDLTQPDLGLTASIAADIFGRADVVIHNAAEISFMQSYHSLRAANVGGTRSLLGLVAAHAAPRRVPVHFVSSAGVAQLAGGGAFGEASVAGMRPPEDGSNGYVAAKWASERLLEEAHDRLGLPVWVHRPSSIMGEGAPDTDLMANLLSYSLKLKALPMLPAPGAGAASRSPGAEAFLDFVDVQTTAAGIVSRVMGGSPGRPDGAVRYEYHSGEYIIPMSALLQARGGMAEEFEDLVDRFALLPLPEWIVKAKEAGLNDLVVALLDTALSRESGLGDWAIFPKLIKG